MAPRFEGISGELMTSTASWTTPDPGTPLTAYSTLPTDPLRIWKTQPSLRKVVSFVAEQLSSLPWHAYARVSDTDRQRASGSRAEALMRAPSKWISGASLTESLVTDWMLWDRYCALVVDGEILRISPRRWTIKSDWLGRPSKIVLHTPAGQPDIDITDAPLIMDWGWGDLSSGGVSPLITLAEILEEARDSVKWRKRQWDNAPRFGGLLKHPGSFKDPKARETFTVSWKAWRDERRGTPILEDGLEYVPAPQLSPKETRDIEGRQWTDIEVCGAYHIPPELLGARPGNFSNMQAFRSMLFGPTLGPKINRMEQAVNRIASHLDPGQPSLYLELSREAAINGSLIEQAQVLQTMTGGPIMSRAEARARLNLPYVEGTDDLIVPLNVLIGGQASPTDSGSQNEAGADGPDQAFGGTSTADAKSRTTSAKDDAATLRTQLDALGVAFRAGVKPESAAQVVGLPNLEFFKGIKPITVRMDDDSAPAAAPNQDTGEGG